MNDLELVRAQIAMLVETLMQLTQMVLRIAMVEEGEYGEDYDNYYGAGDYTIGEGEGE